MVTDRLEKKSVKKTILTATAVIATSILLFMGLQVASASEKEKVEEFEKLDVSEGRNITPELPDSIGEVPSEQIVGEAQVEEKVSSAEGEVSEPSRLEGETLEEYRVRNR